MGTIPFPAGPFNLKSFAKGGAQGTRQVGCLEDETRCQGFGGRGGQVAEERFAAHLPEGESDGERREREDGWTVERLAEAPGKGALGNWLWGDRVHSALDTRSR